MKKIVIIAGIVILAAIFVFAGIFLRSRQKNAPPAGGGETTVQTRSLPNAGPAERGAGGSAAGSLPVSGVSNVANVAAVDFAVLDGGVIRYVDPSGEVIQVTETSSTILSSLKIPDLLDARFSYDGRKALFKSGDSNSPRWRVYDVDKNIWRELPLNARDVVWAPGDYRIAYVSRGFSSSVITTWDLGQKNSAPQKRLALSAEDLTVNWAGPGALLFGERPSYAFAGTVWKYDLNRGSLSVFLDNAAGAEILWGENYGLLFTAHAGGGGGSLFLLGADGTPSQTFSFLTLPEKCAFFSATSSAEQVLCAVPADSRTFAAAALPDDYERGIWNTADNLYVVDLAGGGVVKLNLPADLSADATRIRVSGGAVYFLNRADKKLYKVLLSLDSST